MKHKATQAPGKESGSKASTGRSLSAGRQFQQGATASLLTMQRTHGNRYVQQLLNGKADAHADDNSGSELKQGSGISQSDSGSATNSKGMPLDSSTRSFMESRFKHDFGQVRVHTDHAANEKAEQSNAYALTTGKDIYFAREAYSTKTTEGRATLAHELAHVVQKERKGKNSFAPVASLEAEASLASLRVAKGQTAQVKLASSDNTPLKVTRSDRVGAGIALGVLGGAALGAGVLGLAALFNASLSDSAQAGIVIGGVLLGGIVGGLIGRSRPVPPRGAEPARPEHLETNAPDVQLVADPGQAAPTVLKLLPQGTRVVIVNEGANEPFNAGDARWVKVRVTTGPDMGSEGWVLKSQLVSVPETAEVTPEVAARLFLELAQATFTTEKNTQAPIPFHFPAEGCYARAYRMAQLLTEKGYASEKIFAVSRVAASGGGWRGGLNFQTPYADDVNPGQVPSITWWYHVAPIIKVRTPDNQLVETVIDPSTTTRPVTVDEWTKGIKPGSTFTRKTLDQIDKMVYEEGDYPTGQDLTFTAPREAYIQPEPGVSLAPSDVATRAQATMTEYARLAEVHKLAGAIRLVMKVTPIDVGAIISSIREATVYARNNIPAMFPQLWKSLQSSLSEPDMKRVEEARAQP